MPPALRAPLEHVPASRRPIGVLALLLGIYALALGCWYRSKFVHREVGGKAHVLSAYCFVEVFADAVIIFIVWANNDKITKGILPKTLLVYFVCMGATFYSLTPILRLYDTKVPLWQGFRFAGNLIQLLLFRDLVKQLWGEELSSATPIPTVASSVEGAPKLSDSAKLDQGGGEGSGVPLLAPSSGCSPPTVGLRPCSPAPIHQSRERPEVEVILSVSELIGHK